MAGRITHTIIGMILITYLLCLVIFFFMHENIRLTVDRLNYEVAEVISTSAVFSDELYKYLFDNTQKFGDYMINLRLDKQIKSGVYDTYFNREDIIGKPLRVGDKLTIYLEDKKLTLFGKIINATILGYSNDRYISSSIKSAYTAVVSKNSMDVVKGYDVIFDIKKYSTDPSIAVLVITKLNRAGKYYGHDSHDDVPETNFIHGNSPDEEANTGENYIFDNGDFKKEIELDASGLIKLIRYIQQ